MPSVEQQRQKLVNLLKELFQINQPDLDFGFYRIMHAKSEQVSRFLDKDLLQIIADAFGESSAGKQAELKQAYLEEIETACEYGAQIPEDSPRAREARNRWQAAMDTSTAEGEIYDHLYRFFERYYDNGDFLSKRYYARESAGKAAPYAVPYDGSEVYLHWANKDQYYIKTSEYFTDFTFDLSKAKEVEGKIDPLFASQGIPPLRVHFKIVEATEGEHGNIKEVNGQRRYFILHEDDPVALENGELTIRFEYRPDPEKTGQDAVWQRKRIDKAVETIFIALKKLNDADEFTRMLKVGAPTERQRDRTLLAKYLAKYTARNTMDYFIHKDLGGFLQREIDFYIKNEIMRLDDIENADAPRVEQYLAKIKVFRLIGQKIIAFLTQLENFQKKLWFKKKFVVETNFCITLDRVPEELYLEIIGNEAQLYEWQNLFAIDKIVGDKTTISYSSPLSIAFLKRNQNLSIDTRFFGEKFKEKLLSYTGNYYINEDGILIHSDNFQAIMLLQRRFKNQIKCIYIDPPYNTGNDDFIYKDSYQHSSWASLIESRTRIALKLLNSEGVFLCSLDDLESPLLREIIQGQNGLKRIGEFIWKTRNTDNRVITKFSQDHEYVHVWAKSSINGRTIDRSSFKNPDNDPRGPYVTDPLTGKAKALDRPNLHYLIVNQETGDEYPPDPDFGWITNEVGFKSLLKDNRIYWPERPKTGKPRKKRFLNEMPERAPVSSLAIKIKQGEGNQDLIALFGEKKLNFPKPVSVMEKILDWNSSENEYIIDFFAGSGTTAHAVVNLNRKGLGKRKYILIECGDHFDEIIMPRIKRTVYSGDWKYGKPVTKNSGISHCFKYMRIESYEDCLNNLEFRKDDARDKTVAGSKKLREEYMLHYMLETETRSSQSLLNIDSFVDPTAYKLKVKKPGSDEYEVRNVDLIETFNYLIGLRVEHLDVTQSFTAEFKREPDPELPSDKHTRLKLVSRKRDKDGPWWFRKIEGWLPGDNGRNEKVLVVWRKLTGDQEKDNLMLDEWFKTIRVNPRDFEFDTIYVNGSNNLPNLRLEGENWKVRLIEEDFMKRMWEVEDV